jgi:hypothetical protein
MTKQWITGDLFDVYSKLKNRPWQEQIAICQKLLEGIYCLLNKDHWKVIRIQRDAYNFMMNNIINKKNGKSIILLKNDGVKVQRAHLTQRREIFLNVMNGKWKNGQEIFDYIKSKDICCLSLKNKKVLGIQPDDIIVPKDSDLFLSATVGMRTPGLKEIEFLKQQAIKPS